MRVKIIARFFSLISYISKPIQLNSDFASQQCLIKLKEKFQEIMIVNFNIMLLWYAWPNESKPHHQVVWFMWDYVSVPMNMCIKEKPDGGDQTNWFSCLREDIFFIFYSTYHLLSSHHLKKKQERSKQNKKCCILNAFTKDDNHRPKNTIEELTIV